MSTSLTTAKLSLLPLLLFVSLFLGVGGYYHLQGVEYAFYQLPAPIAIIPAIMLALWLNKAPLTESINRFISGAGHQNIITMCFIYLLAGGFASVAKATGGVDAVVNAGLAVVPSSLILPGLFIISAFVATAMGTSMGTIGAIAPIAYGVAQSTGLDLALVAGTIVSGAMFGDNLSIISDTTIAATQTQGAQMRDKFKENLAIALPAALLTLIVLLVLNQDTQPVQTQAYDIIKVIPYIAILVLAIMGLNVFVVLLLGTLLAGGIGMVSGGYNSLQLAKDIYAGFGSMQEIFLLSMMVGGLGEFVKHNGGLNLIADTIQRIANHCNGLSKKVADQFGIGALVFFSNLCIANNTVAIVVSGDVAKKLAEQGDISAKRSASLLDIFSCVSQGLVPYGAQLLLVAATFHITPIAVMPYVLYCMILALVSMVVIALRR